MKKIAPKKPAPVSQDQRPPKKTPAPRVFWDQAIADEVIARLINGESLKHICQTEGFPTATGILHWVARGELRPEDGECYADFARSYRLAQAARAESMGTEILDIADAEGGLVDKQRLRVDARKWLMARQRPDRWGDKTHTTISGPNNRPIEIISGQMSPADAADAYRRMISGDGE